MQCRNATDLALSVASRAPKTDIGLICVFGTNMKVHWILSA